MCLYTMHKAKIVQLSYQSIYRYIIIIVLEYLLLNSYIDAIYDLLHSEISGVFQSFDYPYDYRV